MQSPKSFVEQLDTRPDFEQLERIAQTVLANFNAKHKDAPPPPGAASRMATLCIAERLGANCDAAFVNVSKEWAQARHVGSQAQPQETAPQALDLQTKLREALGTDLSKHAQTGLNF